MAGGNHTRRQFDLRDLDPLVENREASLFRIILAQLEAQGRGAEAAGELEVWKHRRPFGTRAVVVSPPNQPSVEMVAPKNAGLATFAKNQDVLMGKQRSGITVIGEPPAGQRGTSNFPTVAQVETVGFFVITRVDPDIVAAGFSGTMTFFGAGFSQSPVDVITSLDSLVTFGAVTFVSDTEITAPITVDAAHPGGFPDFDYDRG